MKKMNLLLGALVFAGLGLTSCSNDDDNTSDVGIAGTYKLDEVNTGAATDFNQDGTTHVDQMEESTCYNDSKIVLNSDNTFTYDIKNILVNTADGTSACASNSVAGTWEITSGSGVNAVISATYENENQQDVTLTLVKQGDELTINNALTQYPNRNDAGGAIYSTGSLELVFDRQ